MTLVDSPHGARSGLVYTCVFGAYDTVFPPISKEPGIDYILLTDQPKLKVTGWRTICIDPAAFSSTRMANRYYKIMGHECFEAFDFSIYVDGNVRVLRRLREFLDPFLRSNAALGVFGHPMRSCVAQEIAECIRRGQVSDGAAALGELEDYRAAGFPDDQGLIEAGILLRRHGHPELQAAMQAWWDLVDRYRSRDQFSLPFVLWTTKLPLFVMNSSFRDPNPYFGLYPHSGSGAASKKYAYVAARSFDNRAYRALLWLWQLKWKVERSIRARKGNA